MHHGSNVKTNSFQFMSKTVIGNVFVAEVCWEAVPNMWPDNSKASVTKCGVCAWNSTRSVGGRAEPKSRTFLNQVYVVSKVRRCLAGQRRINETCQFKVETPLDSKPVRVMQNWRDVVSSSSSSKKPSSGILDGLMRQAIQQCITIVQAN